MIEFSAFMITCLCFLLKVVVIGFLTALFAAFFCFIVLHGGRSLIADIFRDWHMTRKGMDVADILALKTESEPKKESVN